MPEVIYFYKISCVCGYVGYYQPPIEDPQCEECRNFNVSVEPAEDKVPCTDCGAPIDVPPPDSVPLCDDCHGDRMPASFRKWHG